MNILLSVFALVALTIMPLVNRLHIPGKIHNPKIEVDKEIPLVLWSVPIYLSYFLYLAGAWLVLLIYFPEKFKYFAFSMIIIGLTTGIINIVFQTRAPRANIKENGVLAKLLKWHYSLNRPLTALPSLHVAETVAISVLFTVFFPKYTIIWLIIAVAISLSTLLAKEHHILDVIIGGVLGFIVPVAIILM